MMGARYKPMSLVGMAMIGLFAIIALLMVRLTLRTRDTELAAMAAKMGVPQEVAEERKKIIEEGLRKAIPQAIPTVAKLATSGDSDLHEWTIGDKPGDMSKPGNHFGATVKVQVTRTKL
jgi:hypothetical protein